MTEVFNDILEKDDKITRVFKPDKKKFWFNFHIGFFFSTFWLFIFLCLTITDSDGITPIPKQYFWHLFGVICGVIVIIYIIAVCLKRISYKNWFYAFTNKKVLVRTGIFGVYYGSYEYKTLTTTIVKVSLLDKVLKHNTGTILFGMINNPLIMVMLKNITEPYEVLKEIKEHINNSEK